MILVTPLITIPDSDIEIKFIRSPGPGGQKVNKVETAVQLRFDLSASSAVPEHAHERLKKLAGQRLTKDGVIVITANRFRSQERNRKDAIERLADLVRQASRPTKVRRETKPSQAGKRLRLEAKRRRGRVKRIRAGVRDVDI